SLISHLWHCWGNINTYVVINKYYQNLLENYFSYFDGKININNKKILQKDDAFPAKIQNHISIFIGHHDHFKGAKGHHDKEG
uniref:hypothetical protein n=1 Tax=Acinetobacter baumannii TaxID=470 RepID=UPI001D0F2970